MQSDSEFTAMLERARRGDAHALNGIFCAYRSILRQRARGMLEVQYAARADSSDLVQETMTQAFQDIQDFRGETQGEWMAWLRSILLARMRRLRRHHRAEKRSIANETANAAALAPRRVGTPDKILIETERRSKLTQALEQLPDLMSEVIVRRVFLQQQFEEVAEALDKTPGATRVLWSRAVQQLREILPTDFVEEKDISRPKS
jgi:RNA polymerase sigma-70 factor (ECF subfamily)